MIIHDVEQNTEEWHALRAGKPTASEFSKLVTSKGEPSKSMKPYALQLAADLYAGAPQDRWEGNKWTERGHDMEDRARAFYENSFPARKVSQVGFVTDDDETIGASPDSMVQLYTDETMSEMVEDDGQGNLEIKCFGAKEHINCLMYFDKNGCQPTTYVQQPQGQMYVCETTWCDLLFWHPELPSLIVRCIPDEAIVMGLELQLDNCIAERNRVIEILNKF